MQPVNELGRSIYWLPPIVSVVLNVLGACLAKKTSQVITLLYMPNSQFASPKAFKTSATQELLMVQSV